MDHKIQTTIPDDAIKSVTEYCKIHGIDLHGRMQIELDKFVANAICQMEQRRKQGQYEQDNFLTIIRKQLEEKL